MSWFRRKVERSASSDERLRSLEETSKDMGQEIEDLSAALEWLSGEVKKLRGKVTGGMRKTHEVDPGSDETGEPYGDAAPYSAGWWERERARAGLPANGGHPSTSSHRPAIGPARSRTG